MSDYSIQLPSKPAIVKEDGNAALFQIDGLYPGYGHTLGNSLRRIILSSLPGAAITSVKIDGVSHEFSTIDGVKEDVITILLNLKKIRMKLHGGEPQTLALTAKGAKTVTAGDITCPSQVEILNPELVVAEISDKKTSISAEFVVEKGLGYLRKEDHEKEKADIGTIILDAIFTPVRRVNYEVENMRVGDRTDFNRLNIFIETDGTVSPREVLERSIEIMIHQLKAIVGFKEEEPEVSDTAIDELSESEMQSVGVERDESATREFLKTRIESLGLSSRTEHALSSANLRTVGGLVRKREDDLLAIEGLGEKGLSEIKHILSSNGVMLKQ